jgi:cell fate regulator YaaT (PSP1 superfamily)
MSCATCPSRGLLNTTEIETDVSCGKLKTSNWLSKIPDTSGETDIVEIRFKNTRKEFFANQNKLPLKPGDYVTVEAERGHDIGQVGLTGRLAQMQLKRKQYDSKPIRTVYRKANVADLEKWQSSRQKEKPVMIRARQIAASLNLEMKISEVEFQGDGSKATFYYIASDRVDFRELIKLYANEFNIRIEMRQIGARQEAAMVGGIGSCGNELCCSSWRSDLKSVLTNAAKIQELPAAAQKLTGQCGKLKCCLMYELDNYLEAQSDFPDILLELETDNGVAYPKKKDILNKIVYYSYSKDDGNNLFPISVAQLKEVIMLNKKGIKPSIKEEAKNDVPLKFVSFENKLKTPRKSVAKKAKKIL